MRTIKKVPIEPLFVELIPEEDKMKQGVLYISKEHSVAIHLCLCGCGNQSVTPLSEKGWGLTEKNGKVSLAPSILNQPCKAHYILTNNVANFV
jgi:hypothetical protein